MTSKQAYKSWYITGFTLQQLNKIIFIAVINKLKNVQLMEKYIHNYNRKILNTKSKPFPPTIFMLGWGFFSFQIYSIIIATFSAYDEKCIYV